MRYLLGINFVFVVLYYTYYYWCGKFMIKRAAEDPQFAIRYKANVLKKDESSVMIILGTLVILQKVLIIADIIGCVYLIFSFAF